MRPCSRGTLQAQHGMQLRRNNAHQPGRQCCCTGLLQTTAAARLQPAASLLRSPGLPPAQGAVSFHLPPVSLPILVAQQRALPGFWVSLLLLAMLACSGDSLLLLSMLAYLHSTVTAWLMVTASFGCAANWCMHLASDLSICSMIQYQVCFGLVKALRSTHLAAYEQPGSIGQQLLLLCRARQTGTQLMHHLCTATRVSSCLFAAVSESYQATSRLAATT